MTRSPKKILFVCGSINQTTQMHQIASQLPEYERWFTPYFADPFLDFVRRIGLLGGTILGNKLIARCEAYLREHQLAIDFMGKRRDYDLVVTCSDLMIQKTIRDKPIILVQEGMTDPPNFWYYARMVLPFLPRWASKTAAHGQSNLYKYFCVASEGYKHLFVKKGAHPEKLLVTGMPNFDDCEAFRRNTFPHRNFVLVTTSDSRDTFVYENRKKFIKHAVKLAAGRPMIFRLHPNEDPVRGTKEVERYAPGALVYTSGKTEEMIANCDALITRFSSTLYVALALGKEVHAEIDVEEARNMIPLQHKRAARNIAAVCRAVLENTAIPQYATVQGPLAEDQAA